MPEMANISNSGCTTFRKDYPNMKTQLRLSNRDIENSDQVEGKQMNPTG